MSETIDGLLYEIRLLKGAAERRRDDIDNWEERLADNRLYQQMQAAKADLVEIKRKEAALRGALTLAAVAQFEKTGEKKINAWVGIRVTERPEYHFKTALNWAITQASAHGHYDFLDLNRRLFEAEAKNLRQSVTSELDFVSWKPMKSIAVASDLSDVPPADLVEIDD